MTLPEPSKQSHIVNSALSVLTSAPVTKVHVNADQEMIVTTRDKALLCLLKYVSYLDVRDRWTTPAGIMASLWLALVTSSFNRAFLGLDAGTWHGMFIVAATCSTVWLVLELIRRFRSRLLTPESIVDMLQASSSTSALEHRETR